VLPASKPAQLPVAYRDETATVYSLEVAAEAEAGGSRRHLLRASSEGASVLGGG